MTNPFAEEIQTKDAIAAGTTVTEGGDTTFNEIDTNPSARQEFGGASAHLSHENGNAGDDFTYHVEHSSDGGSTWNDLKDVNGNRIEGQLVDADDTVKIDVENVPRGHDLRIAGDSGDKSTGGGDVPDISGTWVLYDAKETPV